MEERELDYAVDSKIDMNALDLEWIGHAEMEERYIAQVSKNKRVCIRAIEKEKLADEKVKTTRSQLVAKCHAYPERCIGKEKATGPEAEAYYRTHKKYLKAKKRVLRAGSRLREAEEELETAKDMKDLMHFTKTKALEQLVSLHGQSYFAGPEVPMDLNKEILKKRSYAEKLKESSKKKGRKMKRNSR
jgi:deoxyribodipyrimidine photolyase